MAIGYACIALGVHDTSLKSCLLKNADEERLRDLIELNLGALNRLISYNSANGIQLFRIGSDIIPFASHPSNRILWWEEYREKLQEIGKRITDGKIRVSMHPGQYSVLNSQDSKVVENAINDLKYHSRFLDSLGVKGDCKIILHIGGVYGNKEESIRRFKNHYTQLDEGIKKRLVIENDERSFTIEEVLNIGLEMNIPVIFDNLHHLVNPPLESIPVVDWIKRCGTTWQPNDGKQKIHCSQQAEKGRPGAHSNTIRIEDFLDFYKDIEHLEIDVMLETKDKNISALKCIYCTKYDVPRKYLEREWGRYKYLIMSQSGSLYKKATEIFKSETDTRSLAYSFYHIVEEAASKPYSKGAEENAALHIWGYFKDLTSEKEKKEFKKRLESFMNGTLSLRLVKRYLWKLVVTYKMEYLLAAYYFVGVNESK